MIHPISVIHWILILVLGLYLTHLAKKLEGPRKYFYMSILCITLWLLVDFYLIHATNIDIAVISIYLSSGLVSTAVGLFYLTIISFQKEILSRKEIAISLIPFAAFLIQIYGFGEVIQTGIGFQARYSIHQLLWISILAIVIFYSLHKLRAIKQHVKSHDTKARINMLAASIYISVVSGFIAAFLNNLYPELVPSSLSAIVTAIGLLPSYYTFK